MPITVVANPVVAESPLVTHVGRARWYGADRRGFKPRLIVVHTTESPDASMANSLGYSARRDDKVSTSYFVGEEGIGQDTQEAWRPFTQARWNDEAVALEHIGRAAWSAQTWLVTRPQTVANSEALIEDLCRRLSIPPIWLGAEEVLAGAYGVCDHLICNQAAILEDPSRAGRVPYTHTDAGAGLRELMSGILARVAEKLTPIEEDDDMFTYLARIPDGRFLLVGDSIRVLSRTELDLPPFAGKPVTTIPPVNDAAGDYRAHWLTKAADEYTERIGAA